MDGSADVDGFRFRLFRALLRQLQLKHAVFELGADARPVDLRAESPLALDLAAERPFRRGLRGQLKQTVGDFDGDLVFAESRQVEMQNPCVIGAA